ncbi:MAG: pyridoxal phosphate-dependent aminotransferase [Cryomorphaceae bacterium]|jgi:aspartate/methionine/tyrosine aminotransferase|nr:pyridoxal phosphate-dependent aminotransferase [Cryomorphaceae bacterium]
MGLFSDDRVNMDVLRKRAFNYRWAVTDPDVIPLTAADPDFPVAKEILEEIRHFTGEGYFSYGSPEGNAEFKEAIAQWYSVNYNSTVKSQFILPVNSAAHGLFIAASSVLSAGDSAIIPDPVDFLFRKSVEAAGAEVITCKVDKSTAELSIEHLEQLIRKDTRAILICNPNNPLGKKYTKSYLSDLIAFALKHDLWIISDEIWADITFEGPVTSLFDASFDYFKKKMVVSGLSKNFGLAGLRIGYILCPSDEVFMDVLEASGHKTTAFGIPILSQAAGTAALKNASYWLDEFKVHLTQMKKLVHLFMEEHPLLINCSFDSTYLAFPKLSEGVSSEEFVKSTLDSARVALVPGGVQWFESASEGHIRICFATSEKILNEAFSRMLEVAK